MTPLPSLGATIHRAALVVIVTAMAIGSMSLAALALVTWLGLNIPPASVVVLVIIVLVWATVSQRSAENKAAAAAPQMPHQQMPRAKWEDLRAAAELKNQGLISQDQFDALLASVVPGPPVLPPRRR
jgi:MFS superfamily sulfate permease-like transporter